MYILNDLFDADLDRMNGKTDRPIPSGKVSKRQALFFVILMNFIGLSVPILANNSMSASTKNMSPKNFPADRIALIGLHGLNAPTVLPKITASPENVAPTIVEARNEMAITKACGRRRVEKLRTRAKNDMRATLPQSGEISSPSVLDSNIFVRPSSTSSIALMSDA